MMEEKDIQETAFEAIELAKKTGKIKKGSNEVTKAIEKGQAKLVVIAKDVNPPEIIMHIKPLCKEKDLLFVEVGSKDELGTAAGLAVSTGSVAVTEEGDAKKAIRQITDALAE